MTRISIMYPNTPGSRFDFSYYLDTHMPLSIALLGGCRGYKGVSVERGMGGPVPGSQAAYTAMCHYLFDSVEDFLEAFMPNADKLQGDIPNYTDVEPVIQFNEVLLAG